MCLKSFMLFLFLFTSSINGYPTENNLEAKYDNLAWGWLKFREPASYIDAFVQCDSDNGSVLVSPVNSQVRDAVKDYLSRLGKSGLTIMSGVRADLTKGDYYSAEGVALVKMPVTIDSVPTGDVSSSDSCVDWKTSKAKVGIVKCSDKLPFVCYKKLKSYQVVRCGGDPAYKYDLRTGSCYKFHRLSKTWSMAYMTCRNEKSHLAIINNELENEVLVEIFANQTAHSDTDYVWMGIRDWLNGESWKTATGEILSDFEYNKWAEGEPNNINGEEHCGTLHRHGKYNDMNCSSKLSFVCEKTPEILYN